MATRQSEDESIAVVRQFFEEVFSGGDLDRVDDLVAEDAVGYDPAQPEPVRGPEGIKQLVSTYRSAFPDITFELHETLSDGDLVSVRWVSRGTHEGELMGIEPTEREVEVQGVEIDRIEDGKIAETHVAWDTLGLLRQIGVVPEMPAE